MDLAVGFDTVDCARSDFRHDDQSVGKATDSRLLAFAEASSAVRHIPLGRVAVSRANAFAKWSVARTPHRQPCRYRICQSSVKSLKVIAALSVELQGW